MVKFSMEKSANWKVAAILFLFAKCCSCYERILASGSVVVENFTNDIGEYLIIYDYQLDTPAYQSYVTENAGKILSPGRTQKIVQIPT